MSTQPSTDVIAFRATIELAGKTATGIEDSPGVVAALGTSKRPPVYATLAGHVNEDAKADETRRRRIAKASETLRQAD